MTEIEYICGFALLMAGFNLGFREAGKGLQFSDFKKLYQSLLSKLKDQTT